MVNKELLRTVVGILGNVISFFLFGSPMSTMYKIWKMKAVEGFQPDPYLTTLMNTMLWILYGLPLVHPHSLLIVTINGIGFFMEMCYVIIFLIYGTSKTRRKIAICLVVEIFILAVVVAVTLFSFHTSSKRCLFVGVVCVIITIAMYLSPLLMMKRIITTKSVKYLPFPLSVTNFVNALCWMTYALLRFDPFVLTGNAVGAAGGLAQLILYGIYHRSTPIIDDEDKLDKQKKSDVELAIQDNQVTQITPITQLTDQEGKLRVCITQT